MTTFVIVVTIVGAFVLGAVAFLFGFMKAIERGLKELETWLESRIDKDEPEAPVRRGHSAERFARVWNDSSNCKEVAERLGITEPSTRSMAYMYRKQGVELKRFKLGRRRKEVA
jgi:hypothetical protein